MVTRTISSVDFSEDSDAFRYVDSSTWTRLLTELFADQRSAFYGQNVRILSTKHLGDGTLRFVLSEPKDEVHVLKNQLERRFAKVKFHHRNVTGKSPQTGMVGDFWTTYVDVSRAAHDAYFRKLHGPPTRHLQICFAVWAAFFVAFSVALVLHLKQYETPWETAVHDILGIARDVVHRSET
jgi:hypothetical protein